MSTIKGLSEKNRNLLFELVKEIKAEGYAEGFEAGKSSVESVEEKSPQVAGTTSEDDKDLSEITITTMLDGEIIGHSVENLD